MLNPIPPAAAQLAHGAPADVVILSREGLNELIAAKRIVAGTDVDLARVPLGVAVRAGTPKPDVSIAESFKQILLKAKAVAIPGSTAGIWLTTDLFPRSRAPDSIFAFGSRYRRPRGRWRMAANEPHKGNEPHTGNGGSVVRHTI